MKQFKIIDFWVSTLLIVFFTIAGITGMGITFLYGYFIVGGWQLISMFVHFINHWFCVPGSTRYTYHCMVAIILFCTALGFVFYLLMYIILCILIIAAPVMAIFYTWMCYNETYIKMKRPLALLK